MKPKSNNTCTNHPDKEAVGKCFSCGKAVCKECKVEDIDGLKNRKFT